MSPTYEMLWDCEYCGTKKLLAKTHRHCPNCGGQQKAEWRYFPSDSEKVAVEGHIYVGADRICPACQEPNSAAALHCGGCGAPLSEAKSVATRADQEGKSFAIETVEDAKRENAQAEQKLAAPHPAATKKPSNLKRDLLVLGLFFLGLIAFFLAIGWTKETHVRVDHSWKREIKIESFGPIQDQSWCSTMPADAHKIRRAREVRSHRQVADGEDCSTVRHDNGDGTFRESQKCRTRYRSEPVYDDRCYYTVERWHYNRSLVSQGSGADSPPAWPALVLTKTGNCIGCEREDGRVAEYVVSLTVVDAQQAKHDCGVSETRWSNLALGSEWIADVGALTGHFDCSSLRPIAPAAAPQ